MTLGASSAEDASMNWLEKVYRNMNQSTVQIEVTNVDKTTAVEVVRLSRCEENSYVLTASHVLDYDARTAPEGRNNQQTARIQIHTADGQIYGAKIVAYDWRGDKAILTVPELPRDHTFISLADEDPGGNWKPVLKGASQCANINSYLLGLAR